MMDGSTKCLLVGGPADGRRMLVPDHLRGVLIAERPNFKMISVSAGLHSPDDLVHVKHHQYLREFFSTASKQWAIFRWAEITLEDVTEMLIDGYLEPKI